MQSSGKKGRCKPADFDLSLLEKKIERLWQVLNIPKVDQCCFRKLYFNNLSAESAHAIKTQIRLMKKYRDSTAAVLQQIERRELVLSELYAFLYRESMDLPKFAAGIAEKLIKLREATVAVLESVKSWRKLMWNPHPFIWNSSNYVIKLSNDYEQFLDSIMFVKLQIFVADFVFFIPQVTVPVIEPTEEDEVYKEITNKLVLYKAEKCRYEKLEKMLADEPGLQAALQKQNKVLRKSQSFTPYLKWAPKVHAKYRRVKPLEPREQSLVLPKSATSEKAELMLYESIIKEQVERGRNLMKQYKTYSIERISERSEEDEEGYESGTEQDYKKDSATTTSSSAGKRTSKDSLKESDNLEDLVKAYKKASLK